MRMLTEIKNILEGIEKKNPHNTKMFFKTGPGEYSEHDHFMGIAVPVLRCIAKKFRDLSLPEIHILLRSRFNEERFLALIILVSQYQLGDVHIKEDRYQFYMANLSGVNNWNLVDASAHLIVGHHLWDKDTHPLFILASSNNLWERRISIVSSWYFIRQNDLTLTFKIAKLLMQDLHDLIHKAVGWMLREAGKRDEKQLMIFLKDYAVNMPRTMLRYAIEKMTPQQRKEYLELKSGVA